MRAVGERVTISTTDSDTVARLVLNDLAGTDLEVSSGSLEEAFMALTDERQEQMA